VTGGYPDDAKDHLDVVARKLEQMRLRAKHSEPWTLTGLIGAWRELVGQIERGYDDNVYEYRNDLSVRDLLAELIDEIPAGSVRSWVTSEVEEIDASYRTATREVDEPIFGSDDEPWWWRRVPKTLVGELRLDLADDLNQ
jgi:hypothetical protein